MKGVKPSEAQTEITEPVVDMAEGEEQMELYSIVDGLERATDEQLRVIFGEVKAFHLNRVQGILNEMRDEPANYY